MIWARYTALRTLGYAFLSALAASFILGLAAGRAKAAAPSIEQYGTPEIIPLMPPVEIAKHLNVMVVRESTSGCDYIVIFHEVSGAIALTPRLWNAVPVCEQKEKDKGKKTGRGRR